MVEKPVSLLSKLLIVIVGFGVLAGSIYAMAFIEKSISARVEHKNQTAVNKNASFQKQTRVVITEVMSSNSLTMLDGYGASSDWIEFYNSGDEPVNLKNAGLSTDLNEPMLWEFPDFEIGPQEYRLVFASGVNETDASGNLHLNFKLNAVMGKTLYFTSALGTLLSTIEIPPMESDISYGVSEEGEWLFFNHPTPMQQNGVDGQPKADFKVYIDSPLKITEYMLDNRTVLYDEDGDFVDWVEFYNTGDAPFSLAQLYFTDDKTDLRKWAFPDLEIEPGAYLVVYASGKDKVTGNLHTNFRLSEYETLVVSTRYSEILVELTLNPLLEDISRGIQNDEWVYFSEPTPGTANTPHGFKEILNPSSQVWDVAINEVMARNESFLADADGVYRDWIELKNNTDRDINLTGYTLSKGSGQVASFVFGDYLLPAHGFALFFSSVEGDPGGTGNTIPFSIRASGETLNLCDVECKTPQVFETGYLDSNRSSGLNENHARVFFEIPTPGEANAPPYVLRYAQPVSFSMAGGEIAAGRTLTLTAEPDVKIHYTLDGSTPTTSNALYRNPIELDTTKTVRAIAVAEGLLPSTITTQTYIVGVEHDLPIIALSTGPRQMFGWEGIYSNPFWDHEAPVHVEFFETDGLPALSFDAGVKIFGGFSRDDPQKSLAIHLRKKYGTEEINYPLFEGNEVTSFKHLLLHTSGQDAYMTKIRDAFIHKAVKDVIDIDVMDSRPCVVYINGEYWGLYTIREKVNEDYLASHHGVDPNQVDMLVYNGTVMTGSNEAYTALVDFAATHDLRIQENYDYVASQVDIENLIDYLVIQSYFGNTDSGNIKFWRDQNNGKWRWFLYDMDWALFMSTYEWNNIAQIFNPDGMGFDDWIDTTLHVSLIKNAQFRQEFIERYAFYMNTYFTPERLLPIYDAMIAEIESEMPRHRARWPKPSGVARWEDHVASTRQIIIEKPEIEKQNLKFFFGLSDAEMRALFP